MGTKSSMPSLKEYIEEIQTSEAAANREMKFTTRWLEEKLCVQVSVTKTKVCRPNDTKYLGFSCHKRNDIWRPKPHLKSVQKFKDRLHEYSKRSWSVSMDYRISKMNLVIRGWINYFRICDMKALMKDTDGWLRVRIQMRIWKQWKTTQHREWGLRKLGMNLFLTHVNVNSCKGIMTIASSVIMNRTVTNAVHK